MGGLSRFKFSEQLYFSMVRSDPNMAEPEAAQMPIEPEGSMPIQPDFTSLLMMYANCAQLATLGLNRPSIPSPAGAAWIPAAWQQSWQNGMMEGVALEASRNRGKRKRRYTDACAHCRLSKVRCEEQKPCARCVKHGWKDECVSVAVKSRSTTASSNQGTPALHVRTHLLFCALIQKIL